LQPLPSLDQAGAISQPAAAPAPIPSEPKVYTFETALNVNGVALGDSYSDDKIHLPFLDNLNPQQVHQKLNSEFPVFGKQAWIFQAGSKHSKHLKLTCPFFGNPRKTNATGARARLQRSIKAGCVCMMSLNFKPLNPVDSAAPYIFEWTGNWYAGKRCFKHCGHFEPGTVEASANLVDHIIAQAAPGAAQAASSGADEKPAAKKRKTAAAKQ
jgi:hypothetical protein